MKHQGWLSDGQKHELCTIVVLGCDRVTGCRYLGVDPVRLRQELAHDQLFATQLLRASATAEMHHMRCLHQASRDPKHWRVAQWWLERRAADRYAARKPNALSHEQFDELLDRIARIVVSQVDDALSRRLLEEFEAAARELAARGVGATERAADEAVLSRDDDESDA
jgi:hypothetical protein